MLLDNRSSLKGAWNIYNPPVSHTAHCATVGQPQVDARHSVGSSNDPEVPDALDLDVPPCYQRCRHCKPPSWQSLAYSRQTWVLKTAAPGSEERDKGHSGGDAAAAGGGAKGWGVLGCC